MNVKENELPVQSEAESGAMLSSLINPDWNVAVVGPSESFFIDPGLLYLSHIMAEGGGHLIAIDPKNNRFPKDFPSDDRNRRVVGAGNIDVYFQQLRVLSGMGIPLKFPEHTEAAHAMNFYEPRESFQMIVDHNFSPLFPHWRASGEAIWDRQSDLLALYSSYFGYLSKGGFLYLQTNDQTQNFSDIDDISISLSKLLRRAGFSYVEKIRVQDTYRLVFPTGSNDRIKEALLDSSPRWKAYFSASGHFETYDYADEMVFSLSGINVQYVCPDLYIAQK